MVVPPALLSHASTPQYILDAVIVCLGGIDFGSVQQQPGDPERAGSELGYFINYISCPVESDQ
ncbi:MAG: hypothetical protein NTZ37_04395 [Methanoregula sp.]|nr:hypothetical protein [Methanoregula sp.]